MGPPICPLAWAPERERPGRCRLALHGHLFTKSWGVCGPTHTPQSEYPQDELIYSTGMTSKFIFPAPSPRALTCLPTLPTLLLRLSMFNTGLRTVPAPNLLLPCSAHGTNTHPLIPFPHPPHPPSRYVLNPTSPSPCHSLVQAQHLCPLQQSHLSPAPLLPPPQSHTGWNQHRSPRYLKAGNHENNPSSSHS